MFGAGCGGRVVVDGGLGGGDAAGVGSSSGSTPSQSLPTASNGAGLPHVPYPGPKCAVGECGDACQLCDDTGCHQGVCDIDVVCRIDGPVFECPDNCAGKSCGQGCEICNQDGCTLGSYCSAEGRCTVGIANCSTDGTCLNQDCGDECFVCEGTDCEAGLCDGFATCRIAASQVDCTFAD